MDLFRRIKDFGFRLATKQLNPEQNGRRLINFDKVKTIGVAFDISSAENEAAANETLIYLRGKGKTVTLLAYTGDKKAEQKGDIKLFTPENINWFGVPRSELVTAFCEERFDVLLCPYTVYNRSLNYIALTSKAHCRVGVYSLNGSNDYELMVHLNEDLPVLNIVAQMLRLLQQINTENEII